MIAVFLGLILVAFAQSPATVPANGLQAAIDAAQPGDTLLLASGTVYAGNYILRAKSGSGTITIMSASGVAPAGTRTTSPTGLATIQQTRSAPAIATEPGAHDYAILGVEVLGDGQGDLITLGDGSSAQTTLAQVPQNLTIDRCYIHGDPVLGQKRGIALNSASTTIENSSVVDIKWSGQDSQAVGGWNGPGPYTITNNDLEASGENIMFGGSDPAIPNLIPSDITISNNLVQKPLAWRSQPWLVKNLFELKNAQRVTVTNNTLSNNWIAGQSGYGVQITVRNQDGACPWCTVADVAFVGNTVQHVAAVLNILALDDRPGIVSVRAARLLFDSMRVVDLDANAWGGNGRIIAVQNPAGPDGLIVSNWTVTAQNSGAYVNSFLDLAQLTPPIANLVVSHNVFQEGDYGIHSPDQSLGIPTLSVYAPGYAWSNNTIIRGTSGRYIPYPAGTTLH